MEVNYCTSGFGALIRRDLHKVSLPHILAHNNLNACVILVQTRKATQKCLEGLAMKKCGGKITRLYTWLQDARYNSFLFLSSEYTKT